MKHGEVVQRYCNAKGVCDFASDSNCFLTDAKGTSYIVPTASLAYIELGTEESRRVGFVA